MNTSSDTRSADRMLKISQELKHVQEKVALTRNIDMESIIALYMWETSYSASMITISPFRSVYKSKIGGTK